MSTLDKLQIYCFTYSTNNDNCIIIAEDCPVWGVTKTDILVIPIKPLFCGCVLLGIQYVSTNRTHKFNFSLLVKEEEISPLETQL